MSTKPPGWQQRMCAFVLSAVGSTLTRCRGAPLHTVLLSTAHRPLLPVQPASTNAVLLLQQRLAAMQRHFLSCTAGGQCQAQRAQDGADCDGAAAAGAPPAKSHHKPRSINLLRFGDGASVCAVGGGCPSQHHDFLVSSSSALPATLPSSPFCRSSAPSST